MSSEAQTEQLLLYIHGVTIFAIYFSTIRMEVNVETKSFTLKFPSIVRTWKDIQICFAPTLTRALGFPPLRFFGEVVPQVQQNILSTLASSLAKQTKTKVLII